MTAWTQAGSLTSDRLQPRQPPAPQQQPQLNKKKNNNNSTSQKSKQVQKLEQILQGFQQDNNTRDPAGGCFCQARTHSLSKYTPNCLNCGLVLCTLQLPFHLCPHCSEPLVAQSSRDSLISRIEDELEQVLRKEEEERIRVQQEREQAQGAFPTLASSTGTAEPRKPAQPRNVLSVNSKTGKMKMATYSTPSVLSGYMPEKGKERDKEREVREHPPPAEIDYVQGITLKPTSWKNLRHEVTYIPEEHTSGSGSHRKRDEKT